MGPSPHPLIRPGSHLYRVSVPRTLPCVSAPLTVSPSCALGACHLFPALIPVQVLRSLLHILLETHGPQPGPAHGPHSGLHLPPGRARRPEQQEEMKHVYLGTWPPQECQAAPKDPKAAVSLQYQPGAVDPYLQGQIHSGMGGEW